MKEKSLWQYIRENLQDTQNLPEKNKRRLVVILGITITAIIAAILLPFLTANYRNQNGSKISDDIAPVVDKSKDLATNLSSAKDSLQETKNTHTNLEIKTEYEAWLSLNRESKNTDKTFLTATGEKTFTTDVDQNGFLFIKE